MDAKTDAIEQAFAAIRKLTANASTNSTGCYDGMNHWSDLVEIDRIVVEALRAEHERGLIASAFAQAEESTMGMFDNVVVSWPLPEGYPAPNAGWQSKDMECLLWKYEVTVGGRLVHHGKDTENVPLTPEELQKQIDDGVPEYRRGWPRVKTLREWVRDTNWHGMFNCYHGEKGFWYELTFKFTDGNVVEMEATKEPNENFK